MICPKCHSNQDRVVDSRPTQDDHVWRRRRCRSCRHTWTTYEVNSDAFVRSGDFKSVAAAIGRECERLTAMVRSLNNYRSSPDPE